MEEVFDDPYDKEGSNRTGIFTVKMILHQKIPEWLPMDGLRIKVQHKGNQKLCNHCYGNHLRKDCKEEKRTWSDYVNIFRCQNPEIPDEFYGKWAEIFEKDSPKMPMESDFNLPTTREEYEQMLTLMSSCGIDREAGIKMLRERKVKYDAAVKEFNSKTYA